MFDKTAPRLLFILQFWVRVFFTRVSRECLESRRSEYIPGNVCCISVLTTSVLLDEEQLCSQDDSDDAGEADPSGHMT